MLYYVKESISIGPKRFVERVVRMSGTQRLATAKRLADRVGGFVTEYPGGAVIYSPKLRTQIK